MNEFGGGLVAIARSVMFSGTELPTSGERRVVGWKLKDLYGPIGEVAIGSRDDIFCSNTCRNADKTECL